MILVSQRHFRVLEAIKKKPENPCSTRLFSCFSVFLFCGNKESKNKNDFRVPQKRTKKNNKKARVKQA